MNWAAPSGIGDSKEHILRKSYFVFCRCDILRVCSAFKLVHFSVAIHSITWIGQNGDQILGTHWGWRGGEFQPSLPWPWKWRMQLQGVWSFKCHMFFCLHQVTLEGAWHVVNSVWTPWTWSWADGWLVTFIHVRAPAVHSQFDWQSITCVTLSEWSSCKYVGSLWNAVASLLERLSLSVVSGRWHRHYWLTQWLWNHGTWVPAMGPLLLVKRGAITICKCTKSSASTW